MKCYCKYKFQLFITLNNCSEESIQGILEVFSTHHTKDRKKRTSISLSSDFKHSRSHRWDTEGIYLEACCRPPISEVMMDVSDVVAG